MALKPHAHLGTAPLSSPGWRAPQPLRDRAWSLPVPRATVQHAQGDRKELYAPPQAESRPAVSTGLPTSTSATSRTGTTRRIVTCDRATREAGGPTVATPVGPPRTRWGWRSGCASRPRRPRGSRRA